MLGDLRTRNSLAWKVKCPPLLPNFGQTCPRSASWGGSATCDLWMFALQCVSSYQSKLFRPQESVLCYCPISTELQLVMAHVKEVSHEIFESPGCNVKRLRNEKLFQAQEYSPFRYCPILTNLALILAHEVGLSCVIFESSRFNTVDSVEKLFRPQA
jgi:hypothetical protein